MSGISDLDMLNQDLPNSSSMDIPSTSDAKFSFEDLKNTISDFWNDTKELVGNKIDDVKDFVKDVKDENPSEYHLKDCIKSAEGIFTKEVLTDWGQMSTDQRNTCLQEYAQAVGKNLDINFQGIVFEDLNNTMGADGYNSGDGYIHLDSSFLNDPAKVIRVIDTISHEAFHQFQKEAIDNPEKYGVDEATVNEWKAGTELYTTANPTAYDPWGYLYNTLETGARNYGESVVRGLTKDIINS